MTDRPIIFSAPMIRALLDGRKTQTRRIYRVPAGSYVEQGRVWAMTDGCKYGDAALPCAPGDRLWVREAHALVPSSAYRMSEGVAQRIKPDDRDRACIYRDGWDRSTGGLRWRPSIHMPRWASRLTLTVTDVRVQRLQEISEADAVAEGVDAISMADLSRQAAWTPKGDFRNIWNSIHGQDAWGANPWVAAISFAVQRGNIDQ